MKVWTRFALCVLFLLGIAWMAYSQQFPVMKPPLIVPKVTFDPSTQVFTYSYMITNDSESTAWIENFKLDIARRDRALPGSVAEFNNSNLDPTRVYQEMIQETAGFIISVAFRSAPAGWDAGIGLAQYMEFGAGEEKDVVHPGETKGPFIFVSKGLVGARNCSGGQAINLALLPDPTKATSDEEYQRILDQDFNISNAATFMVPTIGPAGPPPNCDLPCLIDFLSQEKEQAYKLGWITNQGVANALDAKLKEAKLKLQAGDTRVAINILKSFILDLKAQHRHEEPENEEGQKHEREKENESKHVTDNAYYLLKPNAEFILFKLGQLEEQKGRHEK